MEVLLAANADAQELLERLIHRRAKITKFELIEPSLNDIFLERVKGTDV
jgi:ABC-type uncharacterized transport system ATPase subunit